jgi:hypothetical protein
MKPAAAFKATVHGLRQVPSRKVTQLVLEVAIEQTAQIAAICEHGAWVAVARLDEQEVSSPPIAPKERTRFRDLPLSQQAAMRCAEPVFWAFLRQRYNKEISGEDDAATFIRARCDVPSRRDILPGTKPAARWSIIQDEYDTWLTAERAGVCGND